MTLPGKAFLSGRFLAASGHRPSKEAPSSSPSTPPATMRAVLALALLAIRSSSSILQPPSRTFRASRAARVSPAASPDILPRNLPKRARSKWSPTPTRPRADYRLALLTGNARPAVVERRAQLGKRLSPAPPPTANHDATYWYHPNIHNWGNIGPGGWFHAFFAPLATAIIDRTSYSGLNVRKLVHDDDRYFPPGASVLDLACGTGFSTAPSAGRKVIGVDTSPAMLRMARFLRPDATFKTGNAENVGDDCSVDVVSMMFATVRGQRLSHTLVVPVSAPRPFAAGLPLLTARRPGACVRGVTILAARDARGWAASRTAQCDACGEACGRRRGHRPGLS